MDIHLEPESPLTHLTDEELVSLLTTHYFTLATTGAQAIGFVLWDVGRGAFSQYHGLDDERMMRVVLMLAKKLFPVWETPAMDYYKQGKAE